MNDKLVVTTLIDIVDASDGVLSLREAITTANLMPGDDQITFAEDLEGGTLTLSQSELVISDDLAIVRQLRSTASQLRDGTPLVRGFRINQGARSILIQFEVRRLFLTTEDYGYLVKAYADGAEEDQDQSEEEAGAAGPARRLLCRRRRRGGHGSPSPRG